MNYKLKTDETEIPEGFVTRKCTACNREFFVPISEDMADVPFVCVECANAMAAAEMKQAQNSSTADELKKALG